MGDGRRAGAGDGRSGPEQLPDPRAAPSRNRRQCATGRLTASCVSAGAPWPTGDDARGGRRRPGPEQLRHHVRRLAVANGSARQGGLTQAAVPAGRPVGDRRRCAGAGDARPTQDSSAITCGACRRPWQCADRAVDRTPGRRGAPRGRPAVGADAAQRRAPASWWPRKRQDAGAATTTHVRRPRRARRGLGCPTFHTARGTAHRAWRPHTAEVSPARTAPRSRARRAA